MKIGAALRQILLNNPTVATLLGDRIRPMMSAQNAQLPFCIYRIVNTDPQHTAQAPASIDVVDVEFTVFNDDYDNTHIVLDQIKSVLEFYTGTAKGVKIKKCWYAGSRDEFDAPGRMYAHTIFFTIRCKDLVTQTQLLAALLNSTATAVCNVQILQHLQANATVSASATTNLQVSKLLAATLGAYATATCAVSLSSSLAANLSATASSTVAAQVAKKLAGALGMSASATLNIAVYQAQLLAANVSLAGTATTAAQVQKLLAGGLTASATASVDVVIPVSLLLDTYTGSKLAYSLRAIKTGVTSVVRVRRSSDNAESDFTATELTDGTLTTWTGANDGFVRTWYDQSGNANHIGQATAGSQPKIVNAGTYLGRVDFTNGKTLTLGTGVDVFGTNSKMCWFEVTNYNLASTAATGTMHTWGTISACIFYHDVGSGARFYTPGTPNQTLNGYFDNNSTEIYHYSTNAGGTDSDATTQRIRSYKNNASAGTSFNNNKDHWSTELFLALGGTMNAAHTVSRQEWIIFDDDKTDFADIIAAMNSHYATY